MADGVQGMLGDAGACPEIEWRGKVWKVGHPTQRAKACLEELVAAKAVTEVTALKAQLPPDAYAELFKGVLASVTAGAFRTLAEGWQVAVGSEAGAVLFLLSLLRERHPEATEADAKGLAEARPGELQAALARVVPGFFEILLAGVPLPADRKAAVRDKMAGLVATLFPTPPAPSA